MYSNESPYAFSSGLTTSWHSSGNVHLPGLSWRLLKSSCQFSMGKSWRPQISQLQPRQGAKCPVGMGSAPASGKIGGPSLVPRGTSEYIENHIVVEVPRGICYIACVFPAVLRPQGRGIPSKYTPNDHQKTAQTIRLLVPRILALALLILIPGCGFLERVIGARGGGARLVAGVLSHFRP